jgi:hypothetical protein
MSFLRCDNIDPGELIDGLSVPRAVQRHLLNTNDLQYLRVEALDRGDKVRRAAVRAHPDPLKMTHSGLDADELLLPKRAQGQEPRKRWTYAGSIRVDERPLTAGSMYSTHRGFAEVENMVCSAPKCCPPTP